MGFGKSVGCVGLVGKIGVFLLTYGWFFGKICYLSGFFFGKLVRGFGYKSGVFLGQEEGGGLVQNGVFFVNFEASFGTLQGFFVHTKISWSGFTQQDSDCNAHLLFGPPSHVILQSQPQTPRSENNSQTGKCLRLSRACAHGGRGNFFLFDNKQ